MSIMYVCHLLYPLYCLFYVELIWYLDSTQKYDEFLTKFEHNSNSPFSIPFIRVKKFLLWILIYLIKHPSLWQNPLVIFPYVFCNFISLNLTHHYCLQYLHQCLQTQRKHSLLVNCLQMNPIFRLYCVWHKVYHEFWPASQVNMQVAK